jgi:hypothetical protein
MTIWAKHPKIFQTVIAANPVAMIELDRKMMASPAVKTTLIAFVF